MDTQTSYVVPLQFDLFNEKNKPLAIRHLVENIKKHNYTLTTGFIGTPYLNLVLSDNGYDDVAYKLFEQTAYPSWLYPVLQGATTILGTLEFLHVGKWLRPCGYELFQPLFVWRYRGVDDSLYLGYPAG